MTKKVTYIKDLYIYICFSMRVNKYCWLQTQTEELLAYTYIN